MSLTENKSNLVVGFKQVKKLLAAGNCKKIYLAEDCTSNISDSLRQMAGNVEIVTVATMRELGTLCEIDVAASCAAIKLV